MSLVVLATGERFEIENPTGTRDGVLRQRERKIMSLIFKTVDIDKFIDIKFAFSDPDKTERIIIYFPDEKDTSTDDQLEGVANEVYESYTVLGEIKEEEVIIVQGTPNSPPEYGRRLTVEIGQRQYGE